MQYDLRGFEVLRIFTTIIPWYLPGSGRLGVPMYLNNYSYSQRRQLFLLYVL